MHCISEAVTIQIELMPLVQQNMTSRSSQFLQGLLFSVQLRKYRKDTFRCVRWRVSSKVSRQLTQGMIRLVTDTHDNRCVTGSDPERQPRLKREVNPLLHPRHAGERSHRIDPSDPNALKPRRFRRKHGSLDGTMSHQDVDTGAQALRA